MLVDEFREYVAMVQRMTVDFVYAVPDEHWNFTPSAERLGPFSRQLRHVVRTRGVYNAALATGAVDWSRSHEHYVGPLARDVLLAALEEQQRELLRLLDEADTETITLDWGGTPFTFADFTWEFVQHEAIHHGQWSVYAAVAGFKTPDSWQQAWKL